LQLFFFFASETNTFHISYVESKNSSTEIVMLSVCPSLFYCLHRKKIASIGAANQVFVVVAKYTGTAPTASASGKLAAGTGTQIKVLVCLNHCISLGVFLI
jgi:hypothetical protein